jgi:hypothetical protein
MNGRIVVGQSQNASFISSFDDFLLTLKQHITAAIEFAQKETSKRPKYLCAPCWFSIYFIPN